MGAPVDAGLWLLFFFPQMLKGLILPSIHQQIALNDGAQWPRMPLETKQTIHIFWSPWKISANTFITAEKGKYARRGEDLLCFVLFCFPKKRFPPPPNSEIHIVLICLQIKQLARIPAWLTQFLWAKPLLLSTSSSHTFSDHNRSPSRTVCNSFWFCPALLKAALKIL